MPTKYQDLDGSLKPSFKLSPTGVELISGSIDYETSTGIDKAKRLYIKKGDEEDRVLTEYDMTIPNGAIATYSESQDGNFVVFHLHNGAVLSVPKTINTYAGDRYVSNDSDESVDNNIAVFDGTSGRKIKDTGYSVKENLLIDDNEGNRVMDEYSSGNIPTVESIMKLWGESVYILWLRRSGAIGKIPTTAEGWAELEERLRENSFLPEEPEAEEPEEQPEETPAEDPGEGE
jgi:hypothetical protein